MDGALSEHDFKNALGKAVEACKQQTRRQRPPRPTVITCPFTVVCDSREQLSYQFSGLRADADQHRLPLQINVVRGCVPSGDYSILGCESLVAVERKSLEDCYNTIGQHRKRFTRELDRLQLLQHSAVVVEAEWSQILTQPPQHSRLPPKNVSRSILAWQQSHPRTHWIMAVNRDHAEQVTFRILDRWWRNRERAAKELAETEKGIVQA